MTLRMRARRVGAAWGLSLFLAGFTLQGVSALQCAHENPQAAGDHDAASVDGPGHHAAHVPAGRSDRTGAPASSDPTHPHATAAQDGAAHDTGTHACTCPGACAGCVLPGLMPVDPPVRGEPPVTGLARSSDPVTPALAVVRARAQPPATGPPTS